MLSPSKPSPLSTLPIDARKLAGFEVPWGRHIVTRAATCCPRLAVRLGNLESRILADELSRVRIEHPVYVAGLARSGSTILLEMIAAHDGVATQRCRDFPFLFTPYWWNQFLDRSPRQNVPARERVHADGLPVSPESPEALEEPLWMAFFPQSHRAAQSAVLNNSTENAAFEQFYRNHVHKLLLVRGGTRYACKGNYHVARLEYLLKLFPDAKFVIPIRRPRDHIASLMKQHQLFIAGETAHPRALAQMRAFGHFEFGLDRRAIHLEDADTHAEICALWQRGEEVRGWAKYWASVHRFLALRLADNSHLREAALVVHYETLCEKPLPSLEMIAAHCDLTCSHEQRVALAERLHAPTYYRPTFTTAEDAIIAAETDEVYSLFTQADEAPATLPLFGHSKPTRRAAA